MSSGLSRVTIPSTAPGGMTSAELFAAIEAPSARKGWEAVMRTFNTFAEAHARMAELFTERACPATDLILKKLETTKKELADRQLTAARRLDAAKASK